LYTQSQQMFIWLIQNYPDIALYYSELSSTYLGESLINGVDDDQRRKLLTKALESLTEAIKRAPDHVGFQRQRFNLLMNFADMELEHKNYQATLTHLLELRPLANIGMDFLSISKLFLQCTPLIEQDMQLDKAQREERIEKCLKEIVQLIESSRKRGTPEWKTIWNYPELTPYRTHPCLKELLEKMKSTGISSQ
jgi:hypothetical protein